MNVKSSFVWWYMSLVLITFLFNMETNKKASGPNKTTLNKNHLENKMLKSL